MPTVRGTCSPRSTWSRGCGNASMSQNPRRFRSPGWRAMKPDPNKGETAMMIKTNVKAGGLSTYNHNEMLAVRSNVKAGLGPFFGNNHNETLAVRSNVKAGLGPFLGNNHNETLAVRSNVKA